MRVRPWKVALAGLPILLSAAFPLAAAAASPSDLSPVQVILNGRAIALDPPPTIVNDRTLIPLRGLFEAMDATVGWEGESRTVRVRRDDRIVRLRIDRRLACLGEECYAGAVMDVPAQLIGERTFVPLRFVSQALGVHVDWDEARRAVLVDSTRAPNTAPAPVRIVSIRPGQIITDPVEIKVEGPASEAVQVYAINLSTGVGHMVAAGPDVNQRYTYTPDPTDRGMRLLVAATHDGSGAWRYSDPLLVMLASLPKVQLTGLDANGLVTGPITFTHSLNFTATEASYRLKDPATGSEELLGTVGPGQSLTWYPQIGQNGEKQIQVVAADRSGKTYESDPVQIRVQSGYRQFVSGISGGATLTRPVTLRVSTNYPVQAIQYLLNGKHLAWGEHFNWKFGPEANGSYVLQVRVTDAAGKVHELDPISFTVAATPQVWPSGIGPNQVVTGSVTLRSTSNGELTRVSYQLVDENLNALELLGSVAPGAEFSWTPQARHAGTQRLRAVGIARSGQILLSDPIRFRVYTGQIFGPKPVMTKAEFLPVASRLSMEGYRETGMSAALKTAQSILETGWGQSNPVDKYTGQISFNLFGIKGEGPAGSVISNTWEEYNGVAYRVDDYFRAYHSVEESWKDHAALLLTRTWYAPYRAVMTNPVLGAWALRASGYATDSQYPVKLINIMKAYDLFKLDDFEL